MRFAFGDGIDFIFRLPIALCQRQPENIVKRIGNHAAWAICFCQPVRFIQSALGEEPSLLIFQAAFLCHTIGSLKRLIYRAEQFADAGFGVFLQPRIQRDGVVREQVDDG